MRHSFAVSNNPAYVDEERPLSDRGIELLESVAPFLHEWNVQHLYASSAVRTMQTAERLLPTLNGVSEVEVRSDLYLASMEQYVHCLKQTPEEASIVMIVGHNPTVAGLMATWAGEHLSVSPGTLAAFRFDIPNWTDLKLQNALQPELDAFISQGLRMR